MTSNTQRGSITVSQDGWFLSPASACFGWGPRALARWRSGSTEAHNETGTRLAGAYRSVAFGDPGRVRAERPEDTVVLSETPRGLPRSPGGLDRIRRGRGSHADCGSEL